MKGGYISLIFSSFVPHPKKDISNKYLVPDQIPTQHWYVHAQHAYTYVCTCFRYAHILCMCVYLLQSISKSCTFYLCMRIQFSLGKEKKRKENELKKKLIILFNTFLCNFNFQISEIMSGI
jgi:hypothetical protein